MSIFTPCEGGVLKVENTCANSPSAPVIKVSNMGIPSTVAGTVAYTGFMLQLHTNHQFLHALDEFIYVFPFGDRVGELTLTGLSFLGSGDCAGENGAAGMCGIYDYYMSNRLTPTTGKPPTLITIGGCSPPLLGFLTGLRMETVRPELPIVQWVLRFNVILKK